MYKSIFISYSACFMCNNVYLAFKTVSRPEFQPQLCTVGDKDSTVFLYNNVFAHIQVIFALWSTTGTL